MNNEIIFKRIPLNHPNYGLCFFEGTTCAYFEEECPQDKDSQLVCMEGGIFVYNQDEENMLNKDYHKKEFARCLEQAKEIAENTKTLFTLIDKMLHHMEMMEND